MMLYNNTQSVVFSPNDDIEFFDIVSGILQWNTFVQYLLIIYLDYLQLTSIDLKKENVIILRKARSRRYSAGNIVDADYSDCLGLLANTRAQTESQLHRLEPVDICCYLNR